MPARSKPVPAQNDAASHRKPYRRPALKTYGKLEDLTAGGTGNANEGSSSQKPRP